MSKWTSTVTNRLLLETSGGRNFTNSAFLNHARRHRPGRHAGLVQPRREKRRGPRNLLECGVDHRSDRRRLEELISGGGVLRDRLAQYQGRRSELRGATIERERVYNGHISTATYRSGVPLTVAVTNAPAPTTENVKRDLGIYAQDRWTFNRLSLNGGIRFEWLNSYVPTQDVGGGRYVPARHFDAVENVPDFFNISPRLGIAYDLFGNAKTALKFSAGKYSTPLTTSLARELNPLAITTVAIPWSDPNRDGIVQDNELDLTRLPRNFGARTVSTLDPNIKRETNTEYMLGVQHAADAAAGRLCQLVPPGVSEQTDDRQHRARFQRLARDRRGQPVQRRDHEDLRFDRCRRAVEVTNVIRNAGFTEVYNGFEWGADLRTSGGGRVFANVGTQRIIANDCDQPDDPNQLRFCDRGTCPRGTIPCRS